MSPSVCNVLFFTTHSAEKGQKIAIDEIKTIAIENNLPTPSSPVLSMGLRMGECTGALLAVPILQRASSMVNNMATIGEILAPPAAFRRSNQNGRNRMFRAFLKSLSLFALGTLAVAFVITRIPVASAYQASEKEMLIRDEKSDLSRAMTSLGATSTNPENPLISRSSYPETTPHICLAFLSCCERTDLLNHTIAGAVRHMEEGIN
jgi:hypothetical protein